MEQFIIQGGQKLKGSVNVMGAKNAATPVIAATVLIHGECVIHNVPRISDVETMLMILKSMGAKAEWAGEHSVCIDCRSLDPQSINSKAMAKLRSSIFFLACLSQRFEKVRLPFPGGCNIGSRPLDAHIEALRDLGYTVEVSDDTFTITRSGKAVTELVLHEMSVTATENVILGSVLGDRRISIECCAAEPHVQDLCWFLSSAGARIEGIGTHSLKIRGVGTLHSVEHTLLPDQIEAGSFIVLAAATHANVEIRNAAPNFMKFELRKFREAGLVFDITPTGMDPQNHYQLATIKPRKTQAIRAVKKIEDMPYPGFAADLIQPFALLMTQAQGISLVHDWMYDGRQRYVSELQKMGANITILDPHRIIVVGPTALYGKEITSYDLRAGVTLVLAALIASGETIINNIDQVDRGYEHLDRRLAELGANIKRSTIAS